MDEKIESYSKFLDTVPEDDRPYLQAKLLSAKLMKEKLIAMTALAKAQTILAEMDVLMAESNLTEAVDQLENFKNDLSEEVEKNQVKSQKEKVASRNDDNKENTRKSANTNLEKISPDNTKTQKLHNSRSNTPTEKTNKRRHSSPTQSNSRSEKIPKKSHSSTLKNSKDKTLVPDKSTLMSTSMSPISKPKLSPLISQSVETSRAWLEQVKTSLKNSDRTRLENVAQRTIEDDEDTLLIETITPREIPNTHRDAISLSKALQQIMVPKRTAVTHKSKSSSQVDLSQNPMVSKIQVLFEDEPKNVYRKKSHKVKTEPKRDTLNTSTDNLVNSLYKDIMAAKTKEQGLTSISSNSCSKTFSQSGVFSKSILREILEKC